MSSELEAALETAATKSNEAGDRETRKDGWLKALDAFTDTMSRQAREAAETLAEAGWRR